MSWIRSAMSKAAEVGGSTNLRAAVRTYADTVVQHAGYAVVEGARKLQDRIATRNMKSYKDAVRRLEEVSVSSKGEERVQLLRRWLVALKGSEKLSGDPVENDGKNSPLTPSDMNDSPRKPTMVLYYDPENGGAPMNFRDVFLHSQALEGMAMSMILGAPNEEEILLLREIFGLCLTGGEEVHNAIVKSIQDLAEAFSAYNDEVLAKREELLEFAQGAISGVKINADVVRIDSEVSQINQNLNRTKHEKPSSEGSENSSEAISEVIKDPVAHIELCCRLESLLLKKRVLNNGDTPENHAHKVDKLKILSESLLSSSSKTEKRISEHRQQKEEALSFRVAKTSEVSQIEKDLEAEIAALEKKRSELEAELSKVKSSLAAANVRLQNAREEREQFDEASNEILEHFKTKEDELSKAIASYRTEAEICNVFVHFLEATWVFQSSYLEQKDKQVNDELERHEEYFVNVAHRILSAYKEELGPSIDNLKKLVESLKWYEKVMDPDEEFLQDIERRKSREQEYVDVETKIIAIFNAVESIKEQFYNAIDGVSRKGVEKVNELFDAIGKIKGDFECIRRPILRIENQTPGEDTPIEERPQAGASPSSKRAMADKLNAIIAQKLVIGSPRNKYVPLGGSSESSPVSAPKKDNNTLSSERKKGKVPVKEGEKASGTIKELWRLALAREKESRKQSTDETQKNFETAKTEQGKIPQPSISKEEPKELPNVELDKESRELLTVEVGRTSETSVSQESEISQCSRSAGEKSLEHKPQLSETSGEKPLDHDNKIPMLALEVRKDVDGSNKTAETEQGKTSEFSTSEGQKSIEPDEEIPKSTLGIDEEDGQHSGNEVSGWEFDELEKEMENDKSLAKVAS